VGGLKISSAVMALCLVSAGALADSAGNATTSSASPSAGTQANPAQQPPTGAAPSAQANGRAVDEAGRPLPVDRSKAHQPPDESLFTPLAAIADVLGISALLSHFGLEDEVASAVGGILIIALLIVLVFVVWWNLMRRYRITDFQRRQGGEPRRSGRH